MATGAGENKVLTTNASGVATWQAAASTGVPSGAVMFFNLATCPTGWTALATAQGRYLVGLPASGTLAGTQGTQLSNLENRPVGQHTHAVTDPGHTHSYDTMTRPGQGTSGYSAWGTTPVSGVTITQFTGITIGSTGGVVGTNAPYIQFLVCTKN